ncbi:hydroxysqualene dehydroxylase [Nitrospira sp. Kam-Ns4a]
MMRRVLVIGGGPAGLTAALRLSRRGYGVTLLERSKDLGGRLAASPPLLFGCDRAALSLLEELGTRGLLTGPATYAVELVTADGRMARLHRLPLPAPLHLLAGLAAFRALSAGDRWQLLNGLERAWEGTSSFRAGLAGRTADEWLATLGQSDQARAEVWTPLARFLAGGDLPAVSAVSLAESLARWLLAARRHARVLIPTCEAADLLVRPLQERIQHGGAVIRLESPVSHIHFDGPRVSGVQLADGEQLAADWYVAAVPHRDLTPLLPERAVARFSYFQQLTKLSDAPALVVQLRPDDPPPAPRLLLLAGRPFHWLLASAEHVTLVASGEPELLKRPDAALQELARREADRAYPAAGAGHARVCRILRIPRARLLLGPGTAAGRPLSQSPFPNLLLAGDWTDTGLPPTLESAVRSGEVCAQAILDQAGALPHGV